MRSIIKNKRGQFEGMWIVVIFMVLLALAFLSAIGLGIVRWLSAEIKPVITDLGVVEGTNLSAAGEVTFGAIDTIVNLAPMLVGGAYFLLLIGCITLVVSYRTTANPLFIGLFFAFMVLLVLVAILFWILKSILLYVEFDIFFAVAELMEFLNALNSESQ